MFYWGGNTAKRFPPEKIVPYFAGEAAPAGLLK